jgi:hypothetical protein
MKAQVRPWLAATGMVAAALLLFNSASVIMFWGSGGLLTGGGGGFDSPALSQTLSLLGTVGIDFGACLAILALSVLVSRRLLGGRRPVLVGALLTCAVGVLLEWFTYNGPGLGMLSLVFGIDQVLYTIGVPVIAGAWMLRPRHSVVAQQPVADGFTGLWESPSGVLELHQEGLFTLVRAGGGSVDGDWTVRTEPRSGLTELSLSIGAPTVLGPGRQVTDLLLDSAEDGAMLLVTGDAVVYSRRSEELAVDSAAGFVGRLEVLEH